MAETSMPLALPELSLRSSAVGGCELFCGSRAPMMNQFRRPWFISGVLCAIALFSTVLALGLPVIFGRHLVFVVVGPASSVVGGLWLTWWLKKTKSGNQELRKGPE